jgi:hypothetical protein
MLLLSNADLSTFELNKLLRFVILSISSSGTSSTANFSFLAQAKTSFAGLESINRGS